MLLMTVATTVSPASRPCRFMCSASISSTASPSTTRPRWSTKIARSPSPSNATPSRQLVRQHRGRQPRRMRRSARQVDVAAVGLHRRAPRRRSRATRTARTRGRRGRAVGHVDADARAGERAGRRQQAARGARGTASTKSAGRDRARRRAGRTFHDVSAITRFDGALARLRRTSRRGRRTP